MGYLTLPKEFQHRHSWKMPIFSCNESTRSWHQESVSMRNIVLILSSVWATISWPKGNVNLTRTWFWQNVKNVRKPLLIQQRRSVLNIPLYIEASNTGRLTLTYLGRKRVNLVLAQDELRQSRQITDLGLDGGDFVETQIQLLQGFQFVHDGGNLAQFVVPVKQISKQWHRDQTT